MWRALARRALLQRRSTPPLLAVNFHVANRSMPLSVEYPSQVLISSSFHFNQSPRFFSQNSADNHGDSPSEPLFSNNDAAFDFSGLNESGGFEDEDSIFDGAADSPDAHQNFSDLLQGSVVDEVNGGLVRETDPEKVERLLSLLQSSGVITGSIEPHLEGLGLDLDEELVMKVLQTEYVTGENLIGFFRWALKKGGFDLTSKVVDAFVDSMWRLSSKRRREVYALWDLVKEVGDKEGLVSLESLNKIIAQLSMMGKAKAALEVFNKVEEFGCVSNADTYYLTIEALCKRSFYSWAWSVCEKMLTADTLPDSDRVGKIISFLCKGGLGKEAHFVYLYAKDKKIDLHVSSMGLVISTLCRIEKTTKETYETINKDLDRETASLALDMLNEYPSKDRKNAILSFSNVIKKLCWIDDVDRAKKLLLEMIESGPPPGNAIFNFVISKLTKSENMEEALSMMKLMESRGLRPDVYTYTVIMSGFARAGEMDEACKIFDEAKKKHSKLTPVAYHSLIRGFCKLEQFDKAVNLLGEMRKHGVEPQHDEYNKLIKSLCFKALDWETAEKLLEDMHANGLALNGRTRSLIAAVRELQEDETTETVASA